MRRYTENFCTWGGLPPDARNFCSLPHPNRYWMTLGPVCRKYQNKELEREAVPFIAQVKNTWSNVSIRLYVVWDSA
jgi:hypothetical protein